MTHDVFISHSIDDADVADALCAALEGRGFPCWIAPRDVAPGEDRGEAIGGGRALVLILSERSAGAPSVLREAALARRWDVPVVVFRIEDVETPPALDGADGYDALTPPIGPHLDHLGDRVALLLGGSGRQLTEPPRPFIAPGRPSRRWLPIAMAGLAGLAAIALAATVSGQ